MQDKKFAQSREEDIQLRSAALNKSVADLKEEKQRLNLMRPGIAASKTTDTCM